MIQDIKNELYKYKGKEVKLIIDEGRSKKRYEKGILKDIYNRTFVIEINNINTSYTFQDIITKTIIIKNI